MPKEIVDETAIRDWLSRDHATREKIRFVLQYAKDNHCLNVSYRQLPALYSMSPQAFAVVCRALGFRAYNDPWNPVDEAAVSDWLKRDHAVRNAIWEGLEAGKDIKYANMRAIMDEHSLNLKVFIAACAMLGHTVKKGHLQ